MPQFDDLNDADIYWWRPLEGEIDNPDTRQKILFSAYKEIHKNGFQAASLSRILAHTKVTKGALYHHFPNKTELGYAVVDEVIAKRIELSFIQPLGHFDNPIDGFIELIQTAGCEFSMRDIELGCPLSTLSQEMAAIDEGFRLRMQKIYRRWHDSIETVIKAGQQRQQIIAAVDAQNLASMMTATLEGCLNSAKVAQDLEKLQHCGEGLVLYLNLIRQN